MQVPFLVHFMALVDAPPPHLPHLSVLAILPPVRILGLVVRVTLALLVFFSSRSVSIKSAGLDFHRAEVFTCVFDYIFIVCSAHRGDSPTIIYLVYLCIPPFPVGVWRFTRGRIFIQRTTKVVISFLVPQSA